MEDTAKQESFLLVLVIVDSSMYMYNDMHSFTLSKQ